MDVGSKPAFYFWVNLKKANISKWHDLYEHKLCWTKWIEMCFRFVVNNIMKYLVNMHFISVSIKAVVTP